MKHPIYTFLALLSCAYLATANMRGWSLFQNGINRASLNNTAYRYRPSFSSSSGGGWSSGFHK
jgi:type IV secretory pathway TrbL component